MGATRLRESLGYVYFPAGAAYSWMWTNARRARARRSSSSFLPSFPPSCNVCSSSCAIHHAPPLHSAMYSVVCTASSCDVDDNDDDDATSFCFLPAILSLSLSLSPLHVIRRSENPQWAQQKSRYPQHACVPRCPPYPPLVTRECSVPVEPNAKPFYVLRARDSRLEEDWGLSCRWQ